MTSRAGLMVLLAALFASCGPAPRPSPTLPSASVTAMPSNGTTPTTSAVDSLANPNLNIHWIPQSLTTPLLDVNTDGDSIIWSRGDKGASSGGAADLFMYVPGASTATLVYRGADPAGQLSPIAVHNGKYAFVEGYARPGGGQGGWRLWYIGTAGQKPALVDTSETDAPNFPTVAPQIALTNDRLIWSAVHAVDGKARFYLRSYAIGSKKTESLQDSPASDVEYWFPNADDKGRLVYATVDYPTTSSAGELHVYFADLTKSPIQPRRLDADGHATNPLLVGDQVVWKTAAGNVADWGQLMRFSLATGTLSTVRFVSQPKINYPSGGNRFVAAWGWDDTDFELYDVAGGAPVVVRNYGPTSTTGIVRPVAGGDLVTFIVGDAATGADLQLCWLALP